MHLTRPDVQQHLQRYGYSVCSLDEMVDRLAERADKTMSNGKEMDFRMRSESFLDIQRKMWKDSFGIRDKRIFLPDIGKYIVIRPEQERSFSYMIGSKSM